MQIDIAELAARGIPYSHPIHHDVQVERLPSPLVPVATASIRAGDLSCYQAGDGTHWVSRAQLAAAVGFGRKLYDPSDPCFVPPEAMLQLPYLTDPVPVAVADQTVYQRVTLRTAGYTAEYLTALKSAMPPRPLNMHVQRSGLTPLSLRMRINADAIRTFPSESGWWVSADEVRSLLPPGESLDDPQSTWYVDPHEWADHDEVDRLVTEHRLRWPEVYEAPDLLAPRDPSRDGG